MNPANSGGELGKPSPDRQPGKQRHTRLLAEHKPEDDAQGHRVRENGTEVGIERNSGVPKCEQQQHEEADPGCSPFSSFCSCQEGLPLRIGSGALIIEPEQRICFCDIGWRWAGL